MVTYQIIIVAEAISSLSRKDLESKLVASLFDIESGKKVSDGDNDQLEILNYKLTEAIPVDESKL
ncbi:MAG: hypothetical protein AAB116_22120 [Candidatus Poribacteria bacterium]